MTEEQAKTKWCFHFTASHTNPRHRAWAEGDEQLPEPTGPFTYHCIASACMAWRASEAERGPAVERRPASSGSRRPEGGDWGYESPGQNPQGGPDWVRYAPGPVEGYCGLAGQPS